FDKNRRVERLANYGLKDGRVFDFVSRATPTGGKDVAYLNALFKIFETGDEEASARRSVLRVKRTSHPPTAETSAPVREHGEEQERDDIGDLDHRIDGGTGRVLVRIPDSITGHCRLVRLRTFAAVVAVLDKFLGIVPCATTRGHRNRNEQ